MENENDMYIPANDSILESIDRVKKHGNDYNIYKIVELLTEASNRLIEYVKNNTNNFILFSNKIDEIVDRLGINKKLYITPNGVINLVAEEYDDKVSTFIDDLKHTIKTVDHIDNNIDSTILDVIKLLENNNLMVAKLPIFKYDDITYVVDDEPLSVDEIASKLEDGLEIILYGVQNIEDSHNGKYLFRNKIINKK